MAVGTEGGPLTPRGRGRRHFVPQGRNLFVGNRRKQRSAAAAFVAKKDPVNW